jgi:hypothetical protein
LAKNKLRSVFAGRMVGDGDFPRQLEEPMNKDEMLERATAALAPYGITDITVLEYGAGEMVSILITETTDHDTAEMIARDILPHAPAFFDISAFASGATFVHADWGKVGGACFMGRFLDRAERARKRLETARARASAMEMLGNVIEADGLMDVAYVDYHHEMMAHEQETRA